VKKLRESQFSEKRKRKDEKELQKVKVKKLRESQLSEKRNLANGKIDEKSLNPLRKSISSQIFFNSK